MLDSGGSPFFYMANGANLFHRSKCSSCANTVLQESSEALSKKESEKGCCFYGVGAN